MDIKEEKLEECINWFTIDELRTRDGGRIEKKNLR